MGELPLTEEAFYDAADVPNKSIPINEIKYIGLSLQPLTNLTIFSKAPNLEIVNLRLCSFKSFPMDLFSLPKLKSLDLSGNSIQILPSKENFEMLQRLKLLNLSDNNIKDLEEVYKASALPNIEHLILTGNICLSQNDSFNKITKEFKKLLILNDMIITSQHRGYIDDIANYDPNSTLPCAKTDDFIFLYVRYMHASSNERYVRRTNAEFFCLNRVIRKYSMAQKIQSIFRGHCIRSRYVKMKRAAIFIENYIKFWFHKRKKAAIRIKCCFLHSQTRKQIRYIQAVKKVQNAWRKKLIREIAIIEVFECNEAYSFLVLQSNVKKVEQILKANNNIFPFKIETTNYRLIKKMIPISTCLPGSPVIYYSCDLSSQVRLCHSNQIQTKYSVWCKHNHDLLKSRKKVTNNGINWGVQCPFASIDIIPTNSQIHYKKMKNYEHLVEFVFSNRDEFSKIIILLVNSLFITNIILYPKRSLITISSIITIQSAIRMGKCRIKNFQDMKTRAIEHRAIACIRYCLKTMRIRRCCSHIARVSRYFRNLIRSQSFFIPYQYYSSLIKMKKKNDVKFGYAADRTLIISTETTGFLTEIIPMGNIVFALNDLSSLLSVGAVTSKAHCSMFTIPINPKYIKRYKLLKVTFSSPDEAKRRLSLFAWMTDCFNIIMTEKDVLEFCSANVIRSNWRGHSYRRRLVHILAQNGRESTIKLFEKDQKKRKDHSLAKQELIENPDKAENRSVSLSQDPVESLHILRNDYRPWVNHLEFFKNEKKLDHQLNKRGKVNKLSKDDQKIDDDFQSMVPVVIPIVPVPQVSNKKKSKAINNNRNISDKRSLLKPFAPKSKGEVKTNQLLENHVDEDISVSTSSELFGDEELEIIDEDSFDEDLPETSSNDTVSKPFKIQGVNSMLWNRDTPFKALTFDDLRNQSRKKDEEQKSNQFLKTKMTKNANKVPQTSSSSNIIQASSLSNISGSLAKGKLSKTMSLSRVNQVFTSSSNILKTITPKFPKSSSSSSSKEQIKLDSLRNPNNSAIRRSSSFKKLKKKSSIVSIGASSSRANSTSMTHIISNDVLSALDSEFISDQRHMAPFFTGSPKQKSRPLNSIKNDKNNNSILQFNSFIQNVKRSIKPSVSLTVVLQHPIVFPQAKSAINDEKEIDSISKEENGENNEKDILKKRSTNSSAQKSDKSIQMMIQNTFTKLVRLHHIGTLITSSAVVDNTIENKRQVAHQARENLYKTRANSTMNKIIYATSVKQRAVVEKTDNLSNIQEQREKAQHDKTKKVREIREEQKANREKYNRDKLFGQNFVSVSQKIAKKIDSKHKSISSSQNLSQKISSVSILRQSCIEARTTAKEIASDLEQQRRRLTMLDKISIEKKRQKNDNSKLQRMFQITEDKRKESERKKLMKNQRDGAFKTIYTLPPAVPQIKEDETNSAVKAIGQFLGLNLGLVESQLLVDLVSGLLLD